MIYPVTPKHRSKMNDCWYASIQMLVSARGGAKTKPMGADVAYVHVGTGGHRLNAVGKHIDEIKKANGLHDITALIDLSDVGGIATAPAAHGPLMVGGRFGALLNLPISQTAIGRMFGHWIVVAGSDAGTDSVWIHDPLLWVGTWMPHAKFESLSWGTGVPNSVMAARRFPGFFAN